MSCENSGGQQQSGAGSCCAGTSGDEQACPCHGKGVFGKLKACVAMMRRMRRRTKSGAPVCACSGDRPADDEKAAA